MKIDIKNLTEKAVKAMHADFAKEVSKNQTKVNVWAWIALVAFLVQLTGEYFLHNAIVENIGLGAWVVAFVAFALYLSSLANKAKKATCMQHMFIDLLTANHPQIEITMEGENPFDKVEEVKVGEAPAKKPRSRKVPVKSEK